MAFDKALLKDANKTLSTARAKACRLVPFMTDAVYALIPWPTALPDGVNGMAVSETGVLYYDPNTITKEWKLDDVVTGLIHEAEHILRKHHKRGAHQNLPDENVKQIWLAAVDCEVNDDLAAMGLQLMPADQLPKKHGLPDGKTGEWYFEQLKNQKGGQAPKGRSACCGSGAGVPHPDEANWGGPKLVTAEREIQLDGMREQVAEAITKSQGRVPENLRRWAAESKREREKKIPWDKQLAALARNAVSWKRGHTDSTTTRINRRQGGLGFGIGAPRLSAPVAPVVNVALVQDTSGSMGGQEFMDTIQQAQGILDAAGGEVTFISIDAIVHAKVKVTSANQINRHLRGGGGTDFRPAFEALYRQRPRPQIIVFATDGYGAYPEPATVRWCKTIWLMTTSYTPPFGHVIRLHD